MFLYRFFVGPVAAFVIAAVMVVKWPVLDPIAVGIMGVFFVIMLLISVMTAKHIRGLRVALRQEPEPCSMVVKMLAAGRKGPPTYILEMSTADEVWRANLANTKFDRACVGGPHAGRIWRHPVSKVPYAADINGTKLGIIPAVVKVNPDSFMERIIQQVHA